MQAAMPGAITSLKSLYLSLPLPDQGRMSRFQLLL